jgi:hypothetical protein
MALIVDAHKAEGILIEHSGERLVLQVGKVGDSKVRLLLEGPHSFTLTHVIDLKDDSLFRKSGRESGSESGRSWAKCKKEPRK